MRTYISTKKINSIFESNRDELLKFEIALDGATTRIKALQCLAEIYTYPSVEPLTASDKRNIFDICYVLCLPDFGLGFDSKRWGMAKTISNRINNTNICIIIRNLLINYRQASKNAS